MLALMVTDNGNNGSRRDCNSDRRERLNDLYYIYTHMYTYTALPYLPESTVSSQDPLDHLTNLLVGYPMLSLTLRTAIAS